jgi:hypothetical protein
VSKARHHTLHTQSRSYLCSSFSLSLVSTSIILSREIFEQVTYIIVKMSDLSSHLLAQGFQGFRLPKLFVVPMYYWLLQQQQQKVKNISSAARSFRYKQLSRTEVLYEDIYRQTRVGV